MSYIAMLLPREELVYQAQEVAKGHPSVREVRCIQTTDAVEEAARSVKEGAGILVARGLQALRITQALNVPLVPVRLTTQELGLMLLKVKHICAAPRPKVALVAATNMLCDTKCCNILFGVELQVFSYDTEEDYTRASDRAVGWGPDAVIGGERSIAAAEKAGIPALFLDYSEDSLREAIRSAETALYADEQNKRANAQFDALLSSTTDGYLQIGREGRIEKANDIMLGMLECKAETLIGQPMGGTFPGIEKEVIESVLREGNSYSTFLHIHYQAMVVILAPIRLQDGRVEGAVLSCHKVRRSIQLDSGGAQGDLPSRNLADRTFESIHHRSASMALAVNHAQLFSQSMNPVLLVGERGLERNLMAQCIHNNSINRAGPFVQVNCGGLAPQDQMTALFGTGEVNEGGEVDLGAFGTANNGTLFLMELDQLAPTVQYNIYRALRYQRITQHSLERSVHIEVRLIVSSDKSLYNEMKRGEFREDLYYLLSGLRIDLPPLRERPEDLSDILHENFTRVCESFRRYHVLTNGAWELLHRYPWPGNAIQINSFMERMVLTAQHRTIDEVYIRGLWEQMYPELQQSQQAEPVPERRGPEAQRIIDLLEQNGGSRSTTAKQLGISTTTLWRRMKRLGIYTRY